MAFNYDKIHRGMNVAKELSFLVTGQVKSARDSLVECIVGNIIGTIVLGLICFGILYLKRKYL